MKRVLSALSAAAFAAALGLGTFATANAAATPSPATPKPKATAKAKCPAGETYVKGYTKQDGTKVKGYCRKSS
jgi:hypothetical protein